MVPEYSREEASIGTSQTIDGDGGIVGIKYMLYYDCIVSQPGYTVEVRR